MAQNDTAPVTNLAADRNFYNALQLANNICLRVIGKETSSVANPSKKLIYNLINTAITKLVNRSPYFSFLNDTISFLGYDYNGTDIDSENITTVNNTVNIDADVITNEMYNAQPFVYGVKDQLLKSVTINFNKVTITPVGAHRVIVVNDNGGSPNLSSPVLTSSYRSLTDFTMIDQEEFLFPEQFTPVVGTKYWVVLQSTGSYDVTIPAEDASVVAYTSSYSTDGINWTARTAPDVMIQFTYTMNPKNYLYEFDMPAVAQEIQRIYSAPVSLNPLIPQYIFLPYPHDKFQRSLLGQYDLGYNYFAITKIGTDGRKHVLLPRGQFYGTLYADIRMKPPLIKADDDVVMIPSEYCYLIELDVATVLFAMNYGTQDVPNFQLMKYDYDLGVSNLFRDYGPTGDLTVQVIGNVYTPASLPGGNVRGTNDQYYGAQQRGLPKP